jgi:hypothetical protein
MASNSMIGAAIVLFVVAALLYIQSRSSRETFANPLAAGNLAHSPVAGRPYGAYDDADEAYPVPADLNQAPRATPVSAVPKADQRPTGVPGAGTAPKEAMAARKDLYELDSKISSWLDGAAQRDKERPGSLTPEQRQRQVILQARLADVREQLGTGLITDSYRVVAQETRDLRTENAGWGQASPNLEDVNHFATGESADAFLTTELYKEFRRLFDQALFELNSHSQPNPLERVRLKQLQVMRLDLNETERKFSPPPIRVSAAQLYLKQMLKPDQPLPTLFSMEPAAAPEPVLRTDPTDVIRSLRDIRWKLEVRYDPAEQELKRAIAAALDRLEKGHAKPQEIEHLRNQVITYQNRQPLAAHPGEGGLLAWDPSDLQRRATKLCKEVREAFPNDAEALGCPPPRGTIRTEFEAETVLNTVCERLYTSVPSVSPEQFDCPPRPV